MKIYKKLILLLACISACISLIFIVQISAKYLTSTTGNTNLSIAKWNIKVNNQSISESVSATIVPVFEGTDHIAANVIAPTSEGYFDLTFDFSDVDVSFKYDITITNNENSSVSDLVIDSYSIDDKAPVPFEPSNSVISDTIIYSNKVNTQKIRVYIVWNDNADTSLMNNLSDTDATLSGNNALIDVNIAFTQITETP